MKTQHIKGDAVQYVQGNNNALLIHVCNNKGVMGAGIAKQVKHTFPSAYDNYRASCRLGDVTYSDCANVANMVAQEGYKGYERHDRRKRFLNYGALAKCLQAIAGDFELQDLGIDTIILPKLMGADRAGGDWEVVLEMVEYFLGDIFQIVVCEL